MEQNAGQFKLETLERKRIGKRRREKKDVRVHNRLPALLWLNKGYEAQEVAELLEVCPRTVKNWIALYQSGGLDALCSLEYQGDPG
jgi:transposase